MLRHIGLSKYNTAPTISIAAENIQTNNHSLQLKTQQMGRIQLMITSEMFE